jgi:CubicO group peptidase (beta-lactamase class C family)
MFAPLLLTLLLATQELPNTTAAPTLSPPESESVSLLVDALPAEQAEELDAWLADQVARGKVAGVSAQLVRGGKVIFRSVHGELEMGTEGKISADTIFRIYSMTKPITSVAVMQLVEQGKIDLDAPLYTYLPEWKSAMALGEDEEGKTVPVPVNKPITTRHLLRHTAGIGYEMFERGEMQRIYREDRRANGAFKSLEDLSKRLAALPLKHQPGTAFTYGRSADLLGRLVEVVAKQPFDEYLEEHIFQPLGMQDTGFTIPDKDRARLALVHDVGMLGRIKGVATYQDMRFFKEAPVPMGGEGLASTLEDYGRFQSMLLNGGKYDKQQVLKRETVAQMISAESAKGDAHMGRIKFGLGFMLLPDRAEPGLFPVRTYSWSGYARTFFYNDVKDDLGILLYTQTLPSGNEPGASFRAKVAEIVTTQSVSSSR